ncbi:hypothetical protein ECANGB1_2408 [Enterospora canceri]|uniref:Uncharacterized protein n=1 Tax=Enterospora canceri TaxID=1081671 RepID=A0A1Y1S5F6_9MICR|nr:hypothetical protein ECANGB1_2408 [Enterospora canceri]
MIINIFSVMLLQDCSFILYQYVSILKISKNFTGKEISSKIIPFFYYTTLAIIPFVYTTLITINLYYFYMMTVLLPAAVLFLVFFSPKYRAVGIETNLSPTPAQMKTNPVSMTMARLAYVVGSISEIFRSTLRTITPKVGQKKQDRNYLLWYKLQSEGLKALCTWVAQDIFFETGNFRLIYGLSIGTNAIAFGWILLGEKTKSAAKSTSLMEIVRGVRNAFSLLNDKEVINEVFIVVGNTMKIFVGLFSNSILFEIDKDVKEREKEKKGEIETETETRSRNSTGNRVAMGINYFLYKTVNLVSRLILLLTLHKVGQKGEDRKKILGVGYVIGAVKMTSTLCAALLCEFVFKKLDGYNLQFYSFPVVLLVFGFFIKAPTRFIGNAMYFMTSLTLAINDSFSRDVLLKMKNINLFACFNLFMVGLISSVINFTTGYLNMGVRRKCMVYLFGGVGVYALLVICRLLSN